MKIAISTIYGNTYAQDRLFDPDACTIGENLLMPNILLQKRLAVQGDELHSIDMYNLKDVDVLIFQDIPNDSLLTIDSPVKLAKYVLKAKWRRDYFLKATRQLPKERLVLQINEPPSVLSVSYNKKYHGYFSKILTWDDDLVDGGKYQKFFIPEYVPEILPQVPFCDKKLLVMVAGNKTSPHANELYSQRRKVIDFFEDKPDVFDLYGFGWEQENLKNYKGRVDKKLATMANYKFCVCFENIRGLNGYITEKLFDCLFSGCIPIYWGADNVATYIPENVFIDMRQFSSIEEMYVFICNMDKKEYLEYLLRAKEYLCSLQFRNTFSVDAYVKKIMEIIAE